MALPVWIPDPLDETSPPDNVPAGLAGVELRYLKDRVNKLAEAIDLRLDNLAASEVGNDSSVTGTTVKDALNTVRTAAGIVNDSNVPGANLKAVLDSLSASSVANNTSTMGATVADALIAIWGVLGANAEGVLFSNEPDCIVKQDDDFSRTIVFPKALVDGVTFNKGDVLKAHIVPASPNVPYTLPLGAIISIAVSGLNYEVRVQGKYQEGGSFSYTGKLTLSREAIANRAGLGLGQHTYTTTSTTKNNIDIVNTTNRTIYVSCRTTGWSDPTTRLLVDGVTVAKTSTLRTSGDTLSDGGSFGAPVPPGTAFRVNTSTGTGINWSFLGMLPEDM